MKNLESGDTPVWLHYCGGEDVLPEGLIVQASQQSGLSAVRLDDTPRLGAGVILFDRETRRLMRSHLLGMLEPASILQVNRHPGRAPGVTPDRR